VKEAIDKKGISIESFSELTTIKFNAFRLDMPALSIVEKIHLEQLLERLIQENRGE
jgi:hypothetical protein